jgi:glucokinase
VILAGDIGGTKTVLATFGDGPDPVRMQEFKSGDFASLEAVIDAFAPERVAAACFGVAGPVIGDSANITNLPWTIATPSLAQRLGGARVTLLNDLQATAFGMLALPADKFAVLQAPAATVSDGTIAVIAPGTGLGEAVLVSIAGEYRALPSEGGHADFAAMTDDEFELVRFLRKRHGDHVSNERVLCGAGIGDLYSFERERSTSPEPAWLAQQIASGDRNAAVSRAAVAGTDPCCVAALDWFAALLGAEASNLALRSLALGGVVIGGGIPPKVLPILQRGGLIERFNAKGRFSNWTRALGVRVALEPRAALFGAAHHATTKDHAP